MTGGSPQSRKAVISISKQVQLLKQATKDIPIPSDPMAIDPRHVKLLHIVSSRKELKLVNEADEEEFGKNRG